MAKTKISEFSANPANNTDIDNINIAEGCAPSGINDAIRELMAQLKDFQAGTAGDPFNGATSGAHNGTVGATTPASGAFTSLSYTGAFSGDGVTFADATPANTLVTTTDGRVGIGKNNPARALDVAGSATFIGGINIDPATGTSAVNLEIGAGRSGDGASFIDLIGDATYSDYGLRVIRNAGGLNSDSAIEHRGTGSLTLRTIEVAPLVFSTSNTERGRFTSDGRLVVNATSPGSNNGQLHVNGAISAESIIGRQGTGGTSNGSNFNFWWTGSQAQLWVDTTNVGVISLTSDYRIKKDVETQTAPAIERVMQLRPVTYQITDYGTVFKADGKQREGFIAHELQAVIPSGVDGEKDDPNQVQSLRMDAVVAVLTKAIQEQQATITALTARIAALESA
jgi:hypothetical protein